MTSTSLLLITMFTGCSDKEDDTATSCSASPVIDTSGRCGADDTRDTGERCNCLDDDGDGFVDERATLVQVEGFSPPDTPIDLMGLGPRDWCSLVDEAPYCGSFVVGLWAPYDWECAVYYRTHLWKLDDDSLCTSCDYGFFVRAEIEPGMAEALGTRECDPSELPRWPMPETFDTVWGFERLYMPYDDHSTTYTSYYSFSDAAWLPGGTVYFSDSYRDPYRDWDLMAYGARMGPYEAATFGL